MPTAPISDLRPHPKNARRGDVDAVADSLRRHGQYAPVVVDQTGTILAGHHVVQAARQIGWTEVAVHRVTYTPADGEAILVADNRISDLALYDVAGLVDLLHALPDLDGTGFTVSELSEMENSLLSDQKPGLDPAPADTASETDIKVRVGPHRFHVHPDPFSDWRGVLITESGTLRGARKIIRQRLGIPDPEPLSTSPSNPEATPVPPASVEVEYVPCAELIPMNGNARQGDIGAISESLARFGQYKPIVITPDNVVVKGNHTLAAAMALGWNRIQVVRIPVDDDEALRIALVDNRTSDLASYDDEALRRLVGSLANPTGTGYDPEDISDLLSGGPARPSKAARSVTVEVGDIKFRVQKPLFQAWAETLPVELEEAEIADRLGLSVTDCVFG